MITTERTEAQAQASRANGALSTGPKTEEGRARSSRNAVKHGIFAKDLLLEGESAEEFDGLFQALVQHYRPETLLQRELVHEMTGARWRLRRVWRLEADLLSNESAGLEDTERHIRGLNAVARYENRLAKDFDCALARLVELQTERHAMEYRRQASRPAKATVPNEPERPSYTPNLNRPLPPNVRVVAAPNTPNRAPEPRAAI